MANSTDRLDVIKRVMNGVKKPQDLYTSLHRVGDDCTKSDIEEVLKDLLDPKTYELVLRVFHVATDEDTLLEVVEELEKADEETVKASNRVTFDADYKGDDECTVVLDQLRQELDTFPQLTVTIGNRWVKLASPNKTDLNQDTWPGFMEVVDGKGTTRGKTGKLHWRKWESGE